MFCKNCGTEMSDTAKFCYKCGYNRMREDISEERKIVEDTQIKFQLKPKFNFSYKIITTVWRAIVYMFFICFLFTGLYKLWFIYPVTLLIIVGIMLLYIVIKLIFENIQYDDLEYNFYTTKVEYKDGFLNKEEKELKYKFVREVSMHQNVLEKMFNIGTIRIFTNASSGYSGDSSHNSMKGKNGIYIHCLENVKQQYQAIKKIIDEGTSED